MLRLSSLIAALVAGVFVLATPVAAEGLVQLTLDGFVARDGGALVEIGVGRPRPAPSDDIYVPVEALELEEVVLRVHLAQGTKAPDLANLLAARLDRVGFKVITRPATAETGQAHLFIEGVEEVRLRLDRGLRAKVTLCESLPASIRLSPPVGRSSPATILVGVSTLHEHTREQSIRTVSVEVDDQASAATVAEKLSETAIGQGWVCERPTPDSWVPNKMQDGSVLYGTSVQYTADRPWTLTVAVAP